MKVFIDSNVFIYFLTDSEKSKTARELMGLVIDKNYELITSINVVEEVLYILTRELLRNKGILTKQDIIKFISINGYSQIENELSKFISLIGEMEIKIVELKVTQLDLFDIMKKYFLFPNDALIAATCKHYEIKKIVTFDKDFERVDFLDVIKP